MFIIYGTDDCKFCVLSKKFLIKENIDFEFIDISKNKTEILDKFSKISNNQRTIPLIFDNDNFIGGYSNLIEYLSF